MNKPLVVVAADAIEHNNARWSATPATYLEALALCGLLPVQLPTIAEPVAPDALIDLASGVLLTGARSNVDPELYGGRRSEEAGPFDAQRDRMTMRLARQAIARGLPLFAICRGVQELNVAFGGTLHTAVHALPGRDDHRGAESTDMDVRFAIRHEIDCTPGGQLEAILGADSVRVNSVHRQGIDRLGDGLTVEARARDGTIEAVRVEGADAFALGVQWHPEHFVRTDPPSRALFDAFAAAVRATAARQRRVAA